MEAEDKLVAHEGAGCESEGCRNMVQKPTSSAAQGIWEADGVEEEVNIQHDNLTKRATGADPRAVQQNMDVESSYHGEGEGRGAEKRGGSEGGFTMSKVRHQHWDSGQKVSHHVFGDALEMLE